MKLVNHEMFQRRSAPGNLFPSIRFEIDHHGRSFHSLGLKSRNNIRSPSILTERIKIEIPHPAGHIHPGVESFAHASQTHLTNPLSFFTHDLDLDPFPLRSPGGVTDALCGRNCTLFETVTHDRKLSGVMHLVLNSFDDRLCLPARLEAKL